LIELKYLDEANRNNEKCLTIDPQCCLYLFRKENISEPKGQINEALNFYDWIIQNYPYFSEPYYNKANVLFFRLGKKKEALQLADIAVNLCDDKATIYFQKGIF
jgi:tetratricopeptide (TPR) repeat protein